MYNLQHRSTMRKGGDIDEYLPTALRTVAAMFGAQPTKAAAKPNNNNNNSGDATKPSAAAKAGGTAGMYGP